MWLNYTLAIFLLVIAHDASGQNQAAILNPRSSQTLDVVANSVTNLAQKISLAIANPKSKTEIFSPVSIAGALSLLLLGSGGTTKEELMKLMGFQNEQISFTDIHKSFGKLFRELVSNEPTLQVNVPWRETDKCNNVDYDEYESRIGSQSDRQRRDADLSVEVDIGNGIFAQQGQEFDDKYRGLAQQLYQSELKYLDFFNAPDKAVSIINEWVRMLTRGKIPQIVSNLNVETLLVIANTLYFKAEWEEPFLRDATKPKPFFPDGPNKPSKNVPMMAHGGCFPYYFWKEADVRVLGIPYKKNNTMYVFLPNNSDRFKLASLQRMMSATVLNDIISNMNVQSASVQFPKMHLSNSFSLKSVLEQLGAYSIFDQERSDLYRVLSGYHRFGSSEDEQDIFDQLEDTKQNAIKDVHAAFPNCSTIIEKEVENRQKCEQNRLCRYGGDACVCCANTFGNRKRRETVAKAKPLFVNEVVHKVDVTINEKGTEGGAVTATLLDRITPAVTFRANGPFMIIIRDETTKLPLFYGSVYDPTV
ncbi:serine protease inhibitor 28Dc-like isoform X3 [Toxorhynchites rutilus septentrionalis]|uniref:serine protease inhibitor 28Dc-like isoform X3 n=1 Tax=Toxorhynchites rutilus septentrionalis TaxID=329112 RepID=UPI002478E771|nr:serine protease inhibitor 28Dc-like isoform X3 [Toxorhynchites rutilus septentrionalis]